MKKIFTMLVVEGDTKRMENVLNKVQIGLNDWDRSKTFENLGVKLVNYTILCEDDQFESIVNLMNGTRVY